MHFIYVFCRNSNEAANDDEDDMEDFHKKGTYRWYILSMHFSS